MSLTLGWCVHYNFYWRVPDIDVLLILPSILENLIFEVGPTASEGESIKGYSILIEL